MRLSGEQRLLLILAVYVAQNGPKLPQKGCGHWTVRHECARLAVCADLAFNNEFLLWFVLDTGFR